MSQETIDQILQKRRAAEKPAAEEERQQDKFYSLLMGEGLEESYFEIQFADGLHTCLAYGNLTWMTYHPDSGIALDFNGYVVQIDGRGLHPRLFNGIKQKKVAWVKEADVEMQDHKDNDTYISSITIMPPEGFMEGTEGQ